MCDLALNMRRKPRCKFSDLKCADIERIFRYAARGSIYDFLNIKTVFGTQFPVCVYESRKSCPQVYFNLMDERALKLELNPVIGVRTIMQHCGRGSGVAIELREILQGYGTGWINGYITLEKLRFGWYRVINIHWN